MSKKKKEEPEAEDEGAVCPACAEPDVEDGACANCGWIDTDKTRPDDASSEQPRIDPGSSAYVVKRSWFTLYPAMFIAGGIYLAIMLKDEIYNQATGQLSIHPVMAIYLALLSYMTAVFVFNKTTVKVFRDRLEVVRGPFFVPFLRSFSLPSKEIMRIDFHEHRGTKGRVEYVIEAITEGDSHAGENAHTVVTFEKSGKEKGLQLSRVMRRTLQLGTAKKKKEREIPAEEKISPLYFVVFLLFLLPAAWAWEGGIVWQFDVPFWMVEGAVFASVFVVLNFYLDKRINVLKLYPLQKGEKNAGPLVYVAMALGVSLMLLPAVMYVVNAFQQHTG